MCLKWPHMCNLAARWDGVSKVLVSSKVDDKINCNDSNTVAAGMAECCAADLLHSVLCTIMSLDAGGGNEIPGNSLLGQLLLKLSHCCENNACLPSHWHGPPIPLN